MWAFFLFFRRYYDLALWCTARSDYLTTSRNGWWSACPVLKRYDNNRDLHHEHVILQAALFFLVVRLSVRNKDEEVLCRKALALLQLNPRESETFYLPCSGEERGEDGMECQVDHTACAPVD